MNTITVAGHLGADPEVRYTSSNQKVTSFSLAVRSRKSKDQENTIWFRITLWGEQFDKMVPHLKKGSALIVIGELQKPEIFTDREGKPQVSTGITASSLYFSPFGRQQQQNGAANMQAGGQPAMAAASNSTSFAEEAFDATYNVASNKPQNTSNENTQNFNTDDEVPF